MTILKTILPVTLWVLLAFTAPVLAAEQQFGPTKPFMITPITTTLDCGEGASLTGVDSHGTITMGPVPRSDCKLIFHHGFTLPPVCTASTDSTHIDDLRVAPEEDGKSVLFFAHGNKTFQPGDQIFYFCFGETTDRKVELIR